MLLIHQAGSVKVGEVVRYTLTYTPLEDRILPSPEHLFLRIKNSSALPLRAAYLRGPYTLHVSSYPSTFNPNQKLDNAEIYGYPDFEPNLKAAGQWSSRLTVPDTIRSKDGKVNLKMREDGSPQRVTWIIEIASQIIFSSTASVSFELLVARDERSLEAGFAAVASKGHGEPGRLQDFKGHSGEMGERRRNPRQGVYSKAVDLLVEDTVALWNKPALPRWEGQAQPTEPVKTESNQDITTSESCNQRGDSKDRGVKRKHKQKKIHLVILTHGLHSNIGADMLYLKESIDAAAKSAREDSRKRRMVLRQQRRSQKPVANTDMISENAASGKDESSTAALSGGQDELSDHEENEAKSDHNSDEDDEDDEDEEVIVRGFSGNSVRTERGIQYLGKRLARFVLTLTYPDQPYLPSSKSTSRSFSVGGLKKDKEEDTPHKGSSIHHGPPFPEKLPYKHTKISFIGHSLGGLIQMYALAYIDKHSPGFFDTIKPQNFIALASPFLGLSNENPLYVKFALDFGLVGRTGRDLGLSWRAPNLARTGWSAMVAGLGTADKQNKESDPRSKPLLRILPTGPAHKILKLFKNRTVYSNIVNDGIVPLRTSCLLFLDWKGLDRVENAQRENGLITTMARFGWNELTGANSSSGVSTPRPGSARIEDDANLSASTQSRSPNRSESTNVPQIDDARPLSMDNPSESADINSDHLVVGHAVHEVDDIERPGNEIKKDTSKSNGEADSPFGEIIRFFKPGSSKAESPKTPKHAKVPSAYKRAQTRQLDGDETQKTPSEKGKTDRPSQIRGQSFEAPPPKTSFLEAAGDLLSPPIPSIEWLIDPSSRSRTIFHDRIYKSKDIPPRAKNRSLTDHFRSTDGTHQRETESGITDRHGMKIEERIARAYHRDLSWRKVLVRLQPDAHNNMIVRRMFANAYGWDVIKHLCDTHFSDTYATVTDDDDEPSTDRVPNIHEEPTEDGVEVEGQTRREAPGSAEFDFAEIPHDGSQDSWDHEDSMTWDDTLLGGVDTADESDGESEGPFATFQKFWAQSPKDRKDGHPSLALQTEISSKVGRDDAPEGPRVTESLTKSPSPIESHRGLGMIDQKLVQTSANADAQVSIVSAEAARSEAPSRDTLSARKSTELGLRKSIEEQIGGPTTSDILKGATTQD